MQTMRHEPTKRQNSHIPRRGTQNSTTKQNPKLFIFNSKYTPVCVQMKTAPIAGLRKRFPAQSRVFQMSSYLRSVLLVPTRVRQFGEHVVELF